MRDIIDRAIRLMREETLDCSDDQRAIVACQQPGGGIVLCPEGDLHVEDTDQRRLSVRSGEWLASEASIDVRRVR